MRRNRVTELAEKLINKMFEIAGHDVTFKDVSNRSDNWYQEWTITRKQQEKWMKWGADYIHRELGIPKYLAEREMDMFNFNYGLSLKKENIKNKVS